MKNQFPQTTDKQSPRGRLRSFAAHVGAADERGQTTAEFALILVPMLLIIFGIVQFGLSFNAASNQTNIASEVARYAVVNENPGGTKSLQAWGKEQAYTNYSNALNNEGQVCIRFPEDTETKTKAEIGDPVEVEVTSTTHWIPILFSKELSTAIRGRAYMRLEAPPSTYSEGCV